MDTIFALATVPGKSGVAVIRVSGPNAWHTCDIFGFEPVEPRKTALRRLDHEKAGFLDEALVLFFEEGASFTGEPVVELQIHGSIAIAQAVLQCLDAVQGFRFAEAGEFTRRALDNNRLDLTQVEALSDLIDAETEAQRKQAISGFSGRLRDEAERWRADLVHALALLEATIDFADEDVPVDVSFDVDQLLNGVIKSLRREIEGYGISERIRSGFEVAIVGPPNAGKSTLLNALAGREAAITSEIAGTTRDVIEVRMDLDGLAVTFLDTAGLRETEDLVEAKGIALAVKRSAEADLRVFLTVDGERPDIAMTEDDIIVGSKADVAKGHGDISGVTGQGIPELISRVKDILLQRASGGGLVSHERQRQIVATGLQHIERAASFVGLGHDRYDVAAEELRSGVFVLERLVGRVDVEDVLDKVFSSFCIGK